MAKFGRRSYTVREGGGDVADLRARVTITIGGKVHTDVEMRSPGVIAVIARPDNPEVFTIESVEAGGRRYTDFRLPPEAGEPLPWQKAALGIDDEK